MIARDELRYLKNRIHHVKVLKELLNKKDLKLSELYKLKDPFGHATLHLTSEQLHDIIDNKLDSDKFIRKELKRKIKNISEIIKQDNEKLKDYINTIKEILKE